jgi:hypothetical protein
MTSLIQEQAMNMGKFIGSDARQFFVKGAVLISSQITNNIQYFNVSNVNDIQVTLLAILDNSDILANFIYDRDF